ncbi:MAG: outer membrane chaperone Skp [Cytophagales bacterium CG12_big_fil_rev_8_21_14_0_65_40_12]|nr:MAG: outer membrane chaperone Skp [Cytophagales bacterium CG12_big_fil_rev_8_21_14_0_65_40_12]PIW04062.1 MAG: outer membrane chaperone Skp [Cytophagales bacterium CG17_big_fil_post_rev_8_21_14_2_50_40_13]
MNRKLVVALSLLLLAMTAQSQDFKIGYTSIDAIVFNMPEIPGIQSEIETFQKQLSSQVTNKEADIQAKIAEYQQLAQQPNAAQIVLQEKEGEIRRLQSDLQAFSQKAEQALANKNATLFNPVYTKVQNAIEAVRKEKGYAMILNARTGSGDGIVLAANDEDNITKFVFEKLGVPMPAVEEGAPKATNNGN